MFSENQYNTDHLATKTGLGSLVPMMALVQMSKFILLQANVHFCSQFLGHFQNC